jgi:group I intron endonuclease
MITYKAINTQNGKFYIGSTIDFERRKKEHLRTKFSSPFHNTLRKNPGAFEWEIIEDDSDEPILEQALLDMWFGTEQCYNLCQFSNRPPIYPPGEHPNCGRKPTEKELKERSERFSGEGNPMFGRKHTEEAKEKNRQANSGEKNFWFGSTRPDVAERNKERTGEKRPQVAESLRGDKNPMFGKTKEKHHNFGKKRWVNSQGERMLSEESPGEDWQRGMFWKS